jgi:hypothetical protein
VELCKVEEIRSVRMPALSFDLLEGLAWLCLTVLTEETAKSDVRPSQANSHFWPLSDLWHFEAGDLLVRKATFATVSGQTAKSETKRPSPIASPHGGFWLKAVIPGGA